MEVLTLCPPRSAADWQRQVEAALLSKQAAAEESRRQRLERQALVAAADAARRSGRPPLMVPVMTQADRWVLPLVPGWPCVLVCHCLFRWSKRGAMGLGCFLSHMGGTCKLATLSASACQAGRC